MIRFCANPACGRGFVSLAKVPPEVPMLCPTCRRDRAPLSRLQDGQEPKAEEEGEGA